MAAIHSSPSNVIFPSCRNDEHFRCPVESHNTATPVACACPCHAHILTSHRPPNPAYFDSYALTHPSPIEEAWIASVFPKASMTDLARLRFARYLYLTDHFSDDYPVPEHYTAASRPIPIPTLSPSLL